jgi:hypothetical protein
LYAILGNGETVAWLTPHAAVALEEGENDISLGGSWMSHAASISIPTKQWSPWLTLPSICGDFDIVLRLMAASVVYSVILNRLSRMNDILISALTLAYMMEHCRSENFYR